MTAPSISELPSISTLLALVAAVLLVFVSVGVLYLSAVEWRDRRRRQALAKSGGTPSSPAARPFRRQAVPSRRKS